MFQEKRTAAWEIPLAMVKTNYRTYDVNLEHGFFSVICACLAYLGNGFRHGILGTDQSHEGKVRKKGFLSHLRRRLGKFC